MRQPDRVSFGQALRVDTSASFAQFVYPFTFERQTFDARASAVQQVAWSGRDRPLPVWERETCPEHDLLAHVANYLRTDGDAPATAAFWRMSHDAFHAVTGLGASADWTLTLPYGEIPIRLESAQLVLFRIGVGFLTLRARPMDAAVNTWLDFLHFFRFSRGRGGVRLKARRRTGRDVSDAYFPEVAGGLGRHPEGSGELHELLGACLDTAALPGDGSGRWWSDVFVPGQLLPYCALFVDAAPESELPELLYCLRNFFHSRQELRPTPAERDLEQQTSLLPYVAGQWFVFSLSGGAFAAAAAPQTDFFRHTLPNHLLGEYFLVFLIALHQRFALISLSDDVARAWLPAGAAGVERRRADAEHEKRRQAFPRILDRLLLFTARGYFAQIMQLEHHHRYYRKWQEIFQVDQMYAEVRDEVREMHDLVMAREAEDNRKQIEYLNVVAGALAAMIGGPLIVFGYSALPEPRSGWEIPAALLGVAVVFALYAFFALLLRTLARRTDTRSPGRGFDDGLP